MSNRLLQGLSTLAGGFAQSLTREEQRHLEEQLQKRKMKLLEDQAAHEMGLAESEHAHKMRLSDLEEKFQEARLRNIEDERNLMNMPLAQGPYTQGGAPPNLDLGGGFQVPGTVGAVSKLAPLLSFIKGETPPPHYNDALAVELAKQKFQMAHPEFSRDYTTSPVGGNTGEITPLAALKLKIDALTSGLGAGTMLPEERAAERARVFSTVDSLIKAATGEQQPKKVSPVVTTFLKGITTKAQLQQEVNKARGTKYWAILTQPDNFAEISRVWRTLR